MLAATFSHYPTFIIEKTPHVMNQISSQHEGNSLTSPRRERTTTSRHATPQNHTHFPTSILLPRGIHLDKRTIGITALPAKKAALPSNLHSRFRLFPAQPNAAAAFATQSQGLSGLVFTAPGHGPAHPLGPLSSPASSSLHTAGGRLGFFSFAARAAAAHSFFVRGRPAAAVDICAPGSVARARSFFLARPRERTKGRRAADTERAIECS